MFDQMTAAPQCTGEELQKLVRKIEANRRRKAKFVYATDIVKGVVVAGVVTGVCYATIAAAQQYFEGEI